jgi:hypothetical protein
MAHCSREILRISRDSSMKITRDHVCAFATYLLITTIILDDPSFNKNGTSSQHYSFSLARAALDIQIVAIPPSYPRYHINSHDMKEAPRAHHVSAGKAPWFHHQPPQPLETELSHHFWRTSLQSNMKSKRRSNRKGVKITQIIAKPLDPDLGSWTSNTDKQMRG